MEVAAELANLSFLRMLVSSMRAYFHVCALEDVHTYESPSTMSRHFGAETKILNLGSYHIKAVASLFLSDFHCLLHFNT